MQLSQSFLAALAVLAPLATAHGRSRLGHSESKRAGGRFCANSNPPEAFHEQIVRIAANDNTFSRVFAEDAGISKCHRTITVPTYFHAAVRTDAADDYLSVSDMKKQLDVLNAAYKPHDVRFVLQGTERVVQNDLAEFSYTESDAGGVGGTAVPGLEKWWKEGRTGGSTTLHVWLHTSMEEDGLQGIATFPNATRPLSEAWLDGVWVLGDTMPGGSSELFNRGATLVHEVGHWLGLYHVFQGGDCETDGDFISDTPLQATDTFGECPTGKDSCPGQPGLDSIHNYMDYSSDDCLTEFTEGQEARIHNVWKTIRSVEWE